MPTVAVAVDQTETPLTPAPSETEGFSFTIAIGRSLSRPAGQETQMFIDVSEPMQASGIPPATSAPEAQNKIGGHAVADIRERQYAGGIDAVCLLFAFGGFLMLFGSLGGHFTLSKLSAAVCSATFAFVYLQFFALFTVFGGTTPGMMLRGLRVLNFSGEAPTPRQLLWRTAGYILSAGTLFMGFLWSLWDEETLTWHDRVSQTFLSPTVTAETENADTVLSH